MLTKNEMKETPKFTDMDFFQYGMKTQSQTWWGKKIIENAGNVRQGLYGRVIGEWSQKSGWCDGVDEPNFAIERDGEVMVVNVSESGVFIQEGRRKGCSINPLVLKEVD